MTAVLAATAERLVTDPVPGHGSPAGVVIGVRDPSGDDIVAAGTRDPDGDPMTVDTRHDLASVTKIVGTTAAVMALMSVGQLDMTDPVSRFLPTVTADLTIEQLLRHRAGLWEWQPLYLTARDPAAAWHRLDRLPLRYRPDSGFHYSDLGFMLLGRVVARITGEPLDVAVTRLVTEPLGMTGTGYRPGPGPVAASAYGDAAERRMVATGEPYPVLTPRRDFKDWRTTVITGEVNDGNAFHALGGVSGHAGLFGTVTDLLTIGTALARYRDRVGPWDPAVVARFLAPGPDAGRHLGFRSWPVEIDGRTTTMYGHPGFVGCVLGFLPDRGAAVALCGNRLLTDGEPAPTEELWTIVRRAAGQTLGERA